MKIKWFCKKWKELSNDEVYSLLELRSEVFVVEQNCVYQDIDLKDKEALHLLGYLKKNLVAYSRCFNENQYFKETSFGRAIIKKEIRNQKKLLIIFIHFEILVLVMFLGTGGHLSACLTPNSGSAPQNTPMDTFQGL